MNRNLSQSWYKSATREQWKTLFAAQLGWMLDAMDVMLYAFALTAIRNEFSLTSATAGALASVTLIASGLGGALFGILADRIGRVKALTFSILTYSVFTALTATSRSIGQLILWRSLLGLGLGGEWSAGSVLVAESWSPEHRGKAHALNLDERFYYLRPGSGFTLADYLSARTAGGLPITAKRSG